MEFRQCMERKYVSSIVRSACCVVYVCVVCLCTCLPWLCNPSHRCILSEGSATIPNLVDGSKNLWESLLESARFLI